MQKKHFMFLNFLPVPGRRMGRRGGRRTLLVSVRVVLRAVDRRSGGGIVGRRARGGRPLLGAVLLYLRALLLLLLVRQDPFFLHS